MVAALKMQCLNSLVCAGRLNVKKKVQARTLRNTHKDSHYCACIFKMMKQLGVKASEIIQQKSLEPLECACVFFSMDDKAKVDCCALTFACYYV